MRARVRADLHSALNCARSSDIGEMLDSSHPATTPFRNNPQDYYGTSIPVSAPPFHILSWFVPSVLCPFTSSGVYASPDKITT